MIAIAGGKGGCGKTTTTLATARALGAGGVHVRAVDLDAGMPNLHRMADVDRDPSLTDLIETADGASEQAPDEPIQRDATGVEIVPAPRALEDLDVPTALDAIQPEDGIALLDCPAGAGPAATAPLREADAAIVVTTNRRESTEDAEKTVRMARTLGVPVLGAIVTRTDDLPTAVRTTLAIDRAIAVPHSGAPLEDDRVLDRYRQVAGAIRSWLDRCRSPGSKNSNEKRARRSGGEDGCESAADVRSAQSRTVPGDRPGASGTQQVEPNCPNCGNVRPEQSGKRPTRRRDRRSARSRDREDGRSCSRDGGVRSDRQ
ncbi:MinD/ParA family ATP-binding protein [Salinarchaeum laminariae]|uniref:MinD/ParA family ATP-binding protein n=1 Tax=Salinarchaeum laminariae TaxID=869888 RepID=UPI0035C257FD